jgi:glycosyltransferase involved in cell wall biosynthesis
MGLSGVQRTLKFAKYLKHYGWHATVLTVEETGYYAHDESLLKEAAEAGIEIIRTPSNDPNRLFGGWFRKKQSGGSTTVKMPRENVRRWMNRFSQTVFIPDNKIGWMKPAFDKASELLQNDKDFKVIFSSAPPYAAHLIGVALRDKFKLPLVTDFRDPWLDSPHLFLPTMYHRRRHLEMEEKVLQASSKVVVVNRRIKELMLMRYHGSLKHTDIVIIPHGFDPEDFERASVTRTGSKCRFVYSGVFYGITTPEPFLKGLKAAVDKNPKLKSSLEVRLIGLVRDEHLDLIKSLDLDSMIVSTGYKQHLDAISELKAADVLWLTLNRERNSDTLTIGKLFEYIGSGKPIFGISPDGVMKNLILESKVGYVASPDNTAEIAGKILEIYDAWKADALPQPNAEFIARYDRRKLAGDLAKEFELLVDY